MLALTSQSAETYAAPRRQRSTKAGAVKMQRLIDRRHRGFWCITLEMCHSDVDGLVRRGYLDRMERNDPAAVERAIAAVLEQL